MIDYFDMNFIYPNFDLPYKLFSGKHLKISTKMSTTGIKPLQFGGIIVQAPEVWMIKTDSYTEPDGRECSMIEISSVESDPRSIIISYGPMP